MMDRPRSISGGGEDNIGIPDDMRCKRSDGKQWRCTAMSMPDKTVCEKHYFQAKKRTASAAVRANMKKVKTGPIGESDMYLESKSDDMDIPLSSPFGDHSGSFSGKIKMESSSKGQFDYSPEMPSVKIISARNSLRSSEEDQEEEEDGSNYDEESKRSYRTPPPFAVDSSRRSHKMVEGSPMMEFSEESSAASDDNGGQPCHQCRSNNSDRVVWCLKCDKRGYCENCISTWYSDIPVEEIQRLCPACRGTCSCRVCLRGDNLIKAQIRDIPAQDKLQYLYSLLSALLPIVKRIHSEQCSEVELEKTLHGNEIDLARTRLNADEQMCCNFCRIPIIDYHRHCTNCSYDLCLNCCKGIRQASKPSIEEEAKDITYINDEEEPTTSKDTKLSEIRLNSFKNLINWKANSDGSILCPPSEYGGCSSSLLTLKRIFKMNWVAKILKNVEEMVNGCKICNIDDNYEKSVFDDEKFLYTPSSHNVKSEGIEVFRMHWRRGKPVIVKEICDASAMAIWDPMAIWCGIKETADEKMKDSNRTVKAVDCTDWSEINISLEEFMKGYFEGRVSESGKVQLLKLKDWPSPSTSEEFLLYQRPDFVSKLPLLEFVHYKWGLLNVATKLPHYSLQSDVGPKIYFSYGSAEENGKGDCTNNLHMSMHDMVFLLVHACEVKVPGIQGANIGSQKALEKSEANELSEINSISGELSKMSPDADNGFEVTHSKDQEKTNDVEITESHVTEEKTNDLEITESHVTEEKTNDLLITESHVAEEKIDQYLKKKDGDRIQEIAGAGALWDVFRRQDIPKLVEYINLHWNDFGKGDYVDSDCVSRPLYDGLIYLSGHHKTMLKEEFGVEPWSIEQHIGEAIFIPAGCPFQVKHLQSSVQLGLDFLSPESLSEAVRMSEEIQVLPNDHDAKVHMLEVGKISLYAASSAIKEVRKLVLDPKIGPELGFEDPNLTDLVSQNLEKMVKRRQVTCA